ncbi:hypothetical protein F5Y05DRAFT_399100 [Hypoxylon sp. FL0543]|nr:hypothetical protein F5Y05DRAFT_399100 [Hypoxylon sp. FL0543]
MEDFKWLAAAKKSIQRDLETSKKELCLVRDALGELGCSSTREMEAGRRWQDHIFLMGACQECSGSRNYMLEERLRQVRLWSSNKRAGDGISNQVPDEWLMVDIEWRKWLSEQAATQSDEASELSNEKAQDVVEHWGPLILVLAAYTA